MESAGAACYDTFGLSTCAKEKREKRVCVCVFFFFLVFSYFAVILS